MARLIILCAAWIWIWAGMPQAGADTLFVAGGDGIYAFDFDPQTGGLSPALLAAKLESPSALAADPSGWFLLATSNGSHPQPSGQLVSFFVDPNRATLSEIGRVATGGANAAFVEHDPQRGVVFVANDQGGSIAGFPFGMDGKLGGRAVWIKHEGSSVLLPRQAEPHPCQVRRSPDGKHVYVPDLGTDEVFIYEYDERGVLRPAASPTAKVGEGEGPYHLDFHPVLPIVYLTNEISSRITVFQRDPRSGSLTAIQSIGTLPRSFRGSNACSEIRVHPKGGFVYVSNEGHNSIAIFHADERGFLSPVEYQGSGGKVPRHFALDASGKWLIAGNRESGNLIVFSIRPDTGRIAPIDEPIPVWAPAYLMMTQLPMAVMPRSGQGRTAKPRPAPPRRRGWRSVRPLRCGLRRRKKEGRR